MVMKSVLRHPFKSGAVVGVAAVAITLYAVPAAQAAQVSQSQESKPTVVLVHGAFVDASEWDKVIARLQHDGYKVLAPANPLRGLASDADFLRSVLATV